MDLPVVDGDGMGRAFPELQMDTFAIGGLSMSPMALADCHGNVVIFHHVDSAARAEQYGRIVDDRDGWQRGPGHAADERSTDEGDTSSAARSPWRSAWASWCWTPVAAT